MPYRRTFPIVVQYRDGRPARPADTYWEWRARGADWATAMEAAQEPHTPNRWQHLPASYPTLLN